MTAVSAPPAPEPASTSTTPASTRRRISLPTDRYARWLLVITLAALVLRVLFVLVRPQANIGQLLYELRRNREHIAALV